MGRIITLDSGIDSRIVTLDRVFEFKAKADDSGIFEGYASTFGNEDTYGDTIMPGAFKKSIAKYAKDGRRVKMLYQHQRHEPIGTFTKTAEDNHGLYVEGKFTKGVKRADETNALMKDGAIDSMSIGGYVNSETVDNKTGKSSIHEIDLQEISPVTFPANDQARVTAVKSINACVTIDELEAYLRDAGGFSKKEAMAIIARAKGFAVPMRDASDDAAKFIREAINVLSK